MDMLIFDVFGNNNQKVNEIVLEPNKVEVEKFKSTIKSLDQYRFVNLECLPETVESYMARNTSRKFHFIHCIHVLYYVKNPAAIIEAAYNCLEEGGMMLIIHAAASHGINHVKNTFGAKLFASPPKYTPNGSQLEKLVHDLGYKYSSDIINAKLDMTECQNPASQNGNLIWDFITHVASFTENASPEIKGAINDVTKSEFCYRNGGKVFMNIDSSVLIIVK
ncbi:histamine N-methyltransferase-like isoform X2 [Anneissia japonica]|nr:histamine N-methyltransferase-like isoform X2 [Anneissia japonica]